MAAQPRTLLRETGEHECPLTPVPGSVPAVRHRVRSVLTGWHVAAELVEDALLVVSELVTNAIVHALPPAVLRLSWLPAGTLRVEVADTGPAIPTCRVPGDFDPDEHGRGMTIVRALAARHGIRVHGTGVTWWAELDAA
ncbi:ATP-binding protein [Streptomyces sp. J2-1]|uniref:ATP-binding protein n=1 Tax=Streptomyces corallincola TaxID=2851888 RepID=UPI001C37F4E0|nr:ATP-binding protein [Streptomyces corallincola]MBV2356333.1 ATP-binding protein [Streptomyces corallincola]